MRRALVVLAALSLGCAEERAERIVFLSAPQGSVLATQFLPGVEIALVSADGGVVRSAEGEGVSIWLASADTTAKLIGTTSAVSRSGVVRFDSVAVRTAGTHRLRAGSRLGPVIESDPFDIVPGPASAVHIDSVSSAFAGSPVRTWVRLADAYDNPRSGSATISVSVLAADALGGSTIPAKKLADSLFSGTKTRAIVGDAAVFDDLIATKSGFYFLVATAPGFIPDTSRIAFAVWPSEGDRIVWLTQPSDGRVGIALPNFHLVIQDRFGNPVQAARGIGWGLCTASLRDNPSGAALTSGGGRLYTSSEFVSNNHTVVDKPGTGYTMVVTCHRGAPTPLLTSAPSTPFNVLP